MKIAPLPVDEKNRVENLMSYHIIDTDFEEDYDELTKLASVICQTPIALISFIDPQRQWFKAKVGMKVRETPRDYAFCAHAILNNHDVMVISDTLKDERFFDNPLVTDDPNIRFYAGAPLITREGYSLGTLCAIDKVPRELTKDQLNALKVLSRQVIKLLELNKSLSQVKNYSQELNQLNSKKNKFFSIISHDLKSPFISLLGFSEILSNEVDFLSRQEIKELTGKIHTTSRNTYKFIENLLQWSLIERGKMKAHPEEINLNEMFEKIFSLLSGGAEQKNIKLICDDTKSAAVLADRNMIFSLFQNLISNAIKFTPAEGEIKISVKPSKKYVEIKVKDTGVGIEKEKLKDIFEVEGAYSTRGTEGEEGTGLGLALCKQFATHNKGEIAVDSEPGKGTIFTIKLPLNK